MSAQDIEEKVPMMDDMDEMDRKPEPSAKETVKEEPQIDPATGRLEVTAEDHCQCCGCCCYYCK